MFKLQVSMSQIVTSQSKKSLKIRAHVSENYPKISWQSVHTVVPCTSGLQEVRLVSSSWLLLDRCDAEGWQSMQQRLEQLLTPSTCGGTVEQTKHHALINSFFLIDILFWTCKQKWQNVMQSLRLQFAYLQKKIEVMTSPPIHLTWKAYSPKKPKTKQKK